MGARIVIEPILSRLDKVRKSGKGYTARCPAHEDRMASLSLRETNDRVLIHCFAGCPPAAVLGAIGLELADLFDRSEEKPMRKHDRDLTLLSAIRRNPALHHDLEIIRLGADAIRRQAALTPADIDTFSAALRRFDDVISLFKRN